MRARGVCEAPLDLACEDALVLDILDQRQLLLRERLETRRTNSIR